MVSIKIHQIFSIVTWVIDGTGQKKKQFSSWQQLIQELPQGSVLGPLLLNNYPTDLFYLAEPAIVSNFANDTVCYAYDLDLDSFMNTILWH